LGGFLLLLADAGDKAMTNEKDRKTGEFPQDVRYKAAALAQKKLKNLSRRRK
jgi:hypothetical protein